MIAPGRVQSPRLRDRCRRCGFAWWRCMAVRGCCIDCNHRTGRVSFQPMREFP